MRNIVFLILSFCFISACDEVMPVIPEPPVPGEKVVLMEEFSGGSCVPCADAAKKIEVLSAQFPDNFIPLTIHTYLGGTADPYPGAKYDFRTEDGQKLLEFIGLPPVGIPVGAIDRKLFEGEDQLQIPKSQWNSLVQVAVGEDNLANLGMEVSFDEATRSLEIETTLVPVTELTGDLRLIVLINESHLIDKQAVSEGDGLDPEFEHNHILREVISSTTGESLGTTLEAQIPVSKSFSYTIPTDDEGLGWWIPGNMEVVAFVINNNGTFKDVIQVTARHFTE